MFRKIEEVVFVSFQAKRTDGSNEAGIIPSQICEERLVKEDTVYLYRVA